MEKIFKEGQRVMVYDNLLFIDDKTTPCLDLMLPATVVCWYGQLTEKISDDLVLGPYECLIDVVFDHRPDRVSRGHFNAETLEYLLDPELSKCYKPEYVPKLIAKTVKALGCPHPNK